LATLYDNPIAFSLRDGDGVVGEPLEHRLPLRRYRLRCYAIENALLTDACLSLMGTTWDAFREAAGDWMRENPGHMNSDLIEELIGADDRLRHKKIKSVRQIICAIAGCRKPWEVVVGQAIGALRAKDLNTENSLVDFLGTDAVRDIIFRETS
jgi:hypothetical protein